MASGTDLTLTTAVGEMAPDMQRLRANEVTPEDLMGESCGKTKTKIISVSRCSIINFIMHGSSSDSDLLMFKISSLFFV